MRRRTRHAQRQHAFAVAIRRDLSGDARRSERGATEPSSAYKRTEWKSVRNTSKVGTILRKEEDGKRETRAGKLLSTSGTAKKRVRTKLRGAQRPLSEREGCASAAAHTAIRTSPDRRKERQQGEVSVFEEKSAWEFIRS